MSLTTTIILYWLRKLLQPLKTNCKKLFTYMQTLKAIGFKAGNPCKTFMATWFHAFVIMQTHVPSMFAHVRYLIKFCKKKSMLIKFFKIITILYKFCYNLLKFQSSKRKIYSNNFLLRDSNLTDYFDKFLMLSSLEP